MADRSDDPCVLSRGLGDEPMKQRGFGLIVYLVAGGLILAIATGAYFRITRDAYERGYAQAKAYCEAAAQAQRDKEAQQAGKASTGLEAGNAKAKVVYRTITKQVDRYVDRPIYRNVCLDPDGLRDANAAIIGSGSAAGEPDKPVPRPDATR